MIRAALRMLAVQDGAAAPLVAERGFIMEAAMLIRHQAAICGYVVDAVSGLGIGGAEVRIPLQNLLTLARADGFYAFLDLADGSYDLTATAPRFGSCYGSVAVPGVVVASAADGRPTFDAKGRLALPPTCVSGLVQRADTLAPIPRAQVRLRAAGAVVQSDPAGHYQLCAVEAGAQTAVVSAPGFVSSSRVVVLTAGQQAVADFSLAPS